MIIKVPKGTYQIIKDKNVILKTEFLGSGLAVSFLDKKNKLAGLCCYVMPYKEHDIEMETGEVVLSGESIIPLFLEELEKRGADLGSGSFVIAGASTYKSAPEELDLHETNLKIVKHFLKNKGISEEKIIYRINFNCQVFIEVNLKEKNIKVVLNGREETL